MNGLIYEQATGRMYEPLPNGSRRLVGVGYAGKAPHINKTEAESFKAFGPIPRGVWRVLSPYDHARLGPISMPLIAEKATETFGRSGFFIHGDNRRGNRTASSGCIILGRAAREYIAALPRPLTLAVI